ncbi:Penicillin-binding protein 4* [subsurface metagenome]
MPFGQFAKRSIFEALGMSNTVVYDDRNMALPDYATGYIADESGEFRIKHYWNYTVPGDGKVYSTVRDLFLWDQNFYRGTVGGRKFAETMLACGSLNDGQKCKYAFGLDRGEFAPAEHRGLPIVTHGGSCAGGQAVMIRFVQQRLTVILLCNTRNPRFNDLAFRVADIFLDALHHS